ncbi:DUF166 family protein [Clostridium sp. KNHs214]|uniref:DUF166 domain-containing protein n=1 Tax=Clostridium sp. KNHs214 TaxID=1540257 RepID=UPI00055392F9|nr:DUF166 family protein [Clostridium sp. KNHs214]
MKIVIISCEKSNLNPENEFYIKLDSRFANLKFIPNLKDEKDVCTLCGKECFRCRAAYNLDYSEHIVQIIKLPDLYKKFEDKPLSYLPRKLATHDITIAIGIHEDILVEIPKLVKKSSGKALLIPCESGDWVSRWTRDEIINQCRKYDLQYAFPKPFCTLNYGNGETIDKFIDEYKLGKPKFKLYVNNEDIIIKAESVISAPCGNGYNVAKHLVGKKLGEEAKKAVAKYWHSYPCLGGMKIDPELGDTPLHIAGYTHYNALENAEIIRTD